ncbi:MAG TPA: LamG domain-containing protein [Chitinophagaceae bacterium]|nr:LamG domain-containing protein [Chitinophagaceae bacterium]
MAYYPFNGNANDESGNGNNATPKGGIALTTNRNDNANSAYLFDGVDDYLELNGTASLDPQRLSISLWFMMDGNGKMQLIGNNDNADGYPTLYGTTLNYFAPGAHFMVRPPNTCGTNSDAPNEYVQANFSFTSGKWYCYAATYDGLKARIYVDGALIGEENISFPTLAQCTGTTFKIGRWWNGDVLAFKGKIDEVRIYNRALSLDEVKMLCATCSEQ